MNTSHRSRSALVRAIAIATALLAGPAHAGDHRNREEGLPTEVIDAYALDYLTREIQGTVQYRYTAKGEHRLYLEPRIEVGVPNNGQISLRVPTFLTLRARASDTAFDLGRPSLDFLYNINRETLSVPAFAVQVGLQMPGTKETDVRSFDPFARLVLTKAIPGSSYWHRIHLNGLIQPNVDLAPSERRLRYAAGIGYDFRLSPTAIGLIDLVRDRPLTSDAASNFAEIGVRVQLTPLLAFALGGGGGVTDELRPIGRATIGLQWFPF